MRGDGQILKSLCVIFTVRVAKRAKVMFSQVSVCSTLGGGLPWWEGGGGGLPWEEGRLLPPPPRKEVNQRIRSMS